MCICYVSLSVLKIVAAKSEQRDDQDPYKAKLALAEAPSWHTHTHTTLAGRIILQAAKHMATCHLILD